MLIRQLNPPSIPTNVDVNKYNSNSEGDSLVKDSNEDEVLDNKSEDSVEAEDKLQASDDRADSKGAGEPVVIPDFDDDASIQGDLGHNQTGVVNPAQAGVTNPEESKTAKSAGVEEQGTVNNDFGIVEPAGVEKENAIDGDPGIVDAAEGKECTEPGGVTTQICQTVVSPKNYTANNRNKPYNLVGTAALEEGARNGAPIIIQFREPGMLSMMLPFKNATRP